MVMGLLSGIPEVQSDHCGDPSVDVMRSEPFDEHHARSELADHHHRAHYQPVDPLSLQVFYEFAKDAYPFAPPSGNAQMGQTEGRADMFGVDAAFLINEKWKANAYYSRAQNKTRQFAVYTPRINAADQNCKGTTVTTMCVPWMAALSPVL
jgi:hypothetical protein